MNVTRQIDKKIYPVASEKVRSIPESCYRRIEISTQAHEGRSLTSRVCVQDTRTADEIKPNPCLTARCVESQASLALTAPSNILSKEPTTGLALQRATSAHGSSETARLRAIVDSANTARIVDNIDIYHGSAILILNAHLTAGRSVISSSNIGVLDDVRVRRLVGDTAAVDEV